LNPEDIVFGIFSFGSVRNSFSVRNKRKNHEVFEENEGFNLISRSPMGIFNPSLSAKRKKRYSSDAFFFYIILALILFAFFFGSYTVCSGCVPSLHSIDFQHRQTIPVYL